MKILIVNDSSEVIGTIENLEGYDLNKPFARASIIGDIEDIIGEDNENEQSR